MASEVLYVDISVFLSSGGSGGVISGRVEFARVPCIGETVSFSWRQNSTATVPVAIFQGQCKVEHVIHTPVSSGQGVSLILEPITVPTRQDALLLAEFFRESWGLEFDSHMPEDL